MTTESSVITANYELQRLQQCTIIRQEAKAFVEYAQS